MINELIDERTMKTIMIFLFIVSIFILTYGSFKLGQVYICKKSGMELLAEPEIRCATEKELNEIRNPYWWIYTNWTLNETKPI